MQTLMTSLDEWLVRTTIAGGVVLLAGALWMLISRQPAQRQRIGELALLFALLVAVPAAMPSWWSLAPAKTELAFTNDIPGTRTASTKDHHIPSQTNDTNSPGSDDNEYWDWEIIGLQDPNQFEPYPVETDAKPCSQPTEERTEAESSWSGIGRAVFSWTLRILGGIYVVLVGAFLIRCGCGYYGLWRYWRQRRPAPAHVIRVLEELAPNLELHPRIGVCTFVHGPVSYGIWKPTILLPPEYCNEGDPEKLRWILAHELTHLQRRDAWGCLLLALGGAVYFHLPWFWWLKRHVRLAQEYVADAAAAKIASAVDYAQYLLSLTTLAKEPSLASGHAAGVFETHSDLYRRVHMLLRQRNLVEGSCPRWWTFSAAASFLVLAACTAGVHVQADEPDKKPEIIFKFVNDDDQKSGDKKAEKKQEFRIVIGDNDGKGTHVWRLDDGKLVEDKSSDKKMVWRLAGAEGDVQKKIDEAMKKIDQALERLPKDGGSDARAKLEEVKALLKKMRDNKGAIGFAFGDGNAFQWQGKEQFGQWRKMADDEREKAEKVRDQALDAVRRQRAQAQDEQKARREEVEARLQTARARLKEGKMDKDEAIHELEKAIAEKEALLKKLKEADRRAVDESRDKKTVQDFLNKDLLAARQAEAAKAQADAAKAQADAAVVHARRLAEVYTQRAKSKGDESGSTGKGRLGVTMSPVDGNLRSYLDIPQDQGVFITEVFDPSAAWNNGRGMKSSDILVEFAGKKVSSDPEKFRDVISNTSEGSYEAVVIRKGRRTTLSGIKLPGREKKEPKSSSKDGDQASGDKRQHLEFKVVPSGEVKVNPDAIKLHVDGLTALGGLKALDKDAIKGDIILKLDDVKKELKNLDGDIKAKVELLQPQLDKFGQDMKAHIELVKPEIEKGTLKLGELIKPEVAGLHTINGQPLKVLLNAGQDTGKPRLGVQMETVPEAVASQIDLADDRGLMVREVIEGSAAEKAGFQKGDIITVFANKPVTRDASDFHSLIKDLKPGTYTATVLRKGKEVRIRNIRLEDVAKVKEQNKAKAKDWTVEVDKKETEDKEENKSTAKRKAKDDFFPRNNNFNVIGANKQTSVSINNGEFTLKQKDDGKSLTVTGTIVNGKPSPKTITMKDGDTEKEYKSVNDVPQPQRREVEQALRGISGGNNMVRFGNPNFQFGDINAAQMKHIQDAMKELQKQLGDDNPAFQQIEEEMKKLEKELKQLRNGKGGDDKN